jgi:hypothetical protein
MKRFKHIEFYVGLIGASVLFLILEHLTHWEFLLHLAAIPLEVLFAVFIVERFLEQRETKEKRRQLMFIKSHLFRSDMRPLFLADFAALKTPPVTMDKIRTASIEELRDMRRQTETVEFKSPEAMEPVIMEYVKAEPVWHGFKERALTYNFENIFQDMIGILHFTSDVKLFKEKYPHRLFVHEAAKRPALLDRARKIMTNGIHSFLDYAIELKEKQPVMFDEMMADYELSGQMRDAE